MNHARRLINLGLLIGACLLASSQPGHAEDPLRSAFAAPPAEFKSMPLWWFEERDYSTPEARAEMRKQLQEFRDQGGYAGVTPLFLSSRDYMTDKHWEQYGFILETCRELGMKVVFYDDVSFPSGSAGGLMRRRFPEHTACRLDMLESDVTGPRTWEVGLQEMTRAILPGEASDANVMKNWQRDLKDGIVLGAVAMDTKTKERRDISGQVKGQRLSWEVPAGDWKVMAFTLVRPCGYVDYLCPESVDKFLSLTYDEYFRRFPSYFGSTIIMTFFDDVGVRGGGGFGTFRRNWTPAFNEKFAKKHGFDPITLYPALWYDIGDATGSARSMLFDFRAELLAEGYPRRTAEWAKAHGLVSSGHAMGQYKEQPAYMAGDNIRFYRHSAAPMMDSIGGYHHSRPGYKFTSSAATSYDRMLTAVEIYGIYCSTEAMTPELFSRGAIDCFARGANIILPHGVWFNPDNVKIPPELSHRNSRLAPILPAYNDWVGRCSLLLRDSRPVVDIAVFYPVASLLSYARLNAAVDEKTMPGNVHPGDFVPPGTNLHAISNRLTGEIRRDFTFLHPEVLRDRCVVRPGVLRLDNAHAWQEYRVVVLPYATMMEAESLDKLTAFVAGGGKLIAVGPSAFKVDGKPVALAALPSRSPIPGQDQQVVERTRELFGCAPDQAPRVEPFSKQANAAGGAVYIVPSIAGPGLQAALDDAMPCADVAFSAAGPKLEERKGMLAYLHKVKDGRNFYFMANSSDERVDLDVTLRGRLALESWNPYDGTMAEIDAKTVQVGGQDCTRVRLALDAVKTVFFVEKAPAPVGK